MIMAMETDKGYKRFHSPGPRVKGGPEFRYSLKSYVLGGGPNQITFAVGLTKATSGPDDDNDDDAEDVDDELVEMYVSQLHAILLLPHPLSRLPL